MNREGPETHYLSTVTLQRVVGISAMLASLAIAALNFVDPPAEYNGQHLRLLLTPAVANVALFGLLSGVAAFVSRLRWIHVVTAVLTGLLTLILNDESNLTGFVWLIAGLLLGWEYGYFRRQTRLAVGTIVVVFWATWAVTKLVVGGSSVPDLAAATLGGALIGGFSWLLIVQKQRELQARASELEAAVARRTSELADALSEQKLLLAELHHRTKNNLQLVSTMLFFDEEGLASPDPHRARNAQARIQALGRVHEILFARTGSGQVDVADFVSDYLQEAALMAESNGLSITTDVDARVKVRADLAIRFGLILNEIVLNAMEHASSGARRCTIHVRLRAVDKELALVASDDGPGLSTEAPERVGLGIQLIESIASRLGGSAVLNGKQGTTWTVRLPLDRNESAWE